MAETTNNNEAEVNYGKRNFWLAAFVGTITIFLTIIGIIIPIAWNYYFSNPRSDSKSTISEPTGAKSGLSIVTSELVAAKTVPTPELTDLENLSSVTEKTKSKTVVKTAKIPKEQRTFDDSAYEDKDCECEDYEEPVAAETYKTIPVNTPTPKPLTVKSSETIADKPTKVTVKATTVSPTGGGITFTPKKPTSGLIFKKQS